MVSSHLRWSATSSPLSLLFCFHWRTPLFCIVSGHKRDTKHAFYEKSEQNGGNLNRWPLEWQASMLTARPCHYLLGARLQVILVCQFLPLRRFPWLSNEHMCSSNSFLISILGWDSPWLNFASRVNCFSTPWWISNQRGKIEITSSTSPITFHILKN